MELLQPIIHFITYGIGATIALILTMLVLVGIGQINVK